MFPAGQWNGTRPDALGRYRRVPSMPSPGVTPFSTLQNKIFRWKSSRSHIHEHSILLFMYPSISKDLLDLKKIILDLQEIGAENSLRLFAPNFSVC